MAMARQLNRRGYHPEPLRRVYVPKPGRKAEKRPQGHPYYERQSHAGPADDGTGGRNDCRLVQLRPPVGRMYSRCPPTAVHYLKKEGVFGMNTGRAILKDALITSNIPGCSNIYVPIPSSWKSG